MILVKIFLFQDGLIKKEIMVTSYLLILRDNYGITQCIIDKENKNFLELEKTQLETVIKS